MRYQKNDTKPPQLKSVLDIRVVTQSNGKENESRNRTMFKWMIRIKNSNV